MEYPLSIAVSENSIESIVMFRANLLLRWPGVRAFSSYHGQELSKIRNIGISAHVDSGKTTLTERILFYTGRIHKIHEVRGKDGIGAKMDSMELEREKGITIKSAATFTTWKGNHINIIDTPGHVDFTIEVERALRVLDGAVLVICASGGVQSQTMTVDRQMKRYKVPRVIFINKLDRGGANPDRIVVDVKRKLGIHCAAVQAPIGLSNDHIGVIDLIKQKALYFEGERGEIVTEKEVPDNLKELLETKRQDLIGALAEVDEEIADLFLMEEEPTAEQLRKSIKRSVLALKFCPVFMGSAFKDKGVQPLLDGVLDYLPNPSEAINEAMDRDDNTKKFRLVPDASKNLVAMAFKLEKNRFGQLTYIRVYQGKLEKGAQIFSQFDRKNVKVPRLVRMHSDEMEDINGVGPGEICAMFGVDCPSGTTFTDGQFNCTLESMFVPEPVISLSIKPTKSKDLEGFGNALQRFSMEDPTFRVNFDEETGENIISGMGELHLQIYVERMLREYKIECIVGAPKVRYRECIGKKAPFDYLLKKQTGGQGQYGRVIGYLEPLPADSKEAFVFENNLRGENIPPQFHLSCEKGFREAAEKGALTGSPVVGVKVVLEDGASHPVDSSDLAFQSASRNAFVDAFKRADPTILQPVMNVEVEVPAEFQGDVISGLTKRKATVKSTATIDDICYIGVDAALADMFGYSTALRSATEGKGNFAMEYQEHRPVMKYEQDKIVADYEKHKHDEDF